MEINKGRISSIRLCKVLLGLFCIFVFAFLVFPSLVAVPMSFTSTRFLTFPPRGFSLEWYEMFLTDERWISPTVFSLKVASLSTLVSLALGIMASVALVRGTLPGRKVLNLFFMSPMMVPVIIIAFAAYGTYAKLHLIGSNIGMVLGHTVLCIPFVILVINANLYRFDVSLEMAARNLGASAIKTFWHVTLPLISRGIIAAGVFCFITSMDDLVMAMFIAGTKRVTLPIRIFSQLKFRIDPVVAAASTSFIVISFAIVIILAFVKRDGRVRTVREVRNDLSD